MGYFTNQFIHKGRGERQRKFEPIAVNITASDLQHTGGPMSRVVCEIRGVNALKEYQCAFLTQEELDAAGKFIVDRMTDKAREDVLASALATLTDRKLLRLLATDLRKRVKVPNAG
jgi:hypothetical protein